MASGRTLVGISEWQSITVDEMAMWGSRATLCSAALLAAGAWIGLPAPTGPASFIDETAPRAERPLRGRPRGLVLPLVEAGAARAPDVGGVAGSGTYAGDFYRMVAEHGGVAAAKAVLDKMCEGQAPGMILAVYRPGDVERDGWCSARHGEAQELLGIGRASTK